MRAGHSPIGLGTVAMLVSTVLFGWAGGSTWIIAATGLLMTVLSFLAVAFGPETLPQPEMADVEEL